MVIVHHYQVDGIKGDIKMSDESLPKENPKNFQKKYFPLSETCHTSHIAKDHEHPF